MFSKKKKIRSEILLRVSAALLAAVLTVGSVSFPEKSPVNSDTAVIVADAAFSKGEYKVSDSDGVNVRKGAGTKYGKVGAAAKGKKFTVTKISGDWGYTESIQCTNGNKAGWVCLKYCSKVKSDTSKAGTYKVYNCTGLNVRKKASTSSKIITTLKPGTKVVITSVSGNWGKIKEYGSTNCDGYVYMDYCKYVNNTVTVSAVNASTNAVKKVTNKNSTATAYVTPLINKNSYYISPACATKCVIDVQGSKTANKTNVLINTKSKAKSQKIKAVDAGDGYYVFYDTNSNKVLDVAGGKAANGTNVQIYKYNGTKSQKWRLVDAGDGYYYIQSALNSNYYLDVSGGSSKSGTNVQIYKGNQSKAQKFKFTSISPEIKFNVTSYSQSDPRWANVKLGYVCTIASDGCLVTSLAMLHSFTTHKTVTPKKMAGMLEFTKSYIKEDDSNLCWSSLYSLGYTYNMSYNNKSREALLEKIYEQLKLGKPVIIGASIPDYQHWVVITGYKGNGTDFKASDFTINDPGYDNDTLADFLKTRKIIHGLIY